MGNSSAVPSNFGWDFQVNAAIVMLLNNIDYFSSIRMEGRNEDIEVNLINNMKIYAQAKSITRFDDYKNCISNLKKAVKTLSNVDLTDNNYELVYITNTPNPLSNQNEMSQFYGEVKKGYNEITNKGQATIDKAILDLENLDTNNIEIFKEKFSIQVIPFHSDDLKIRYRVVYAKLNDYLSTLHTSLTAHTELILKTWQSDIFKNGSVSNQDVSLSKRELHLPILVADLASSSIFEIDNELGLGFDESEIEEYERYYDVLIGNNIHDYSILTRIYKSYHNFRKDFGRNYKGTKVRYEFIERESFRMCSLLSFGEGLSPETTHILTKIILFKVLSSRFKIEKILKDG